MRHKNIERQEPRAFSIRLSEAMYEWLEQNAKKEHRSLNAQIAIELEKQMQQSQNVVTLHTNGAVDKAIKNAY